MEKNTSELVQNWYKLTTHMLAVMQAMCSIALIELNPTYRCLLGSYFSVFKLLFTFWSEPERAKHSSILWLTKTSPVLLPGYSIQVMHICSYAGIKSGPLLTSIVSEHTVMHSSHTNRKRVDKSLHMINTPSAVQLSKNLSCLLSSTSSQVCLHNVQH